MKNVVKNAVTGKGKSRGAVWCGVVLGFLVAVAGCDRLEPVDTGGVKTPCEFVNEENIDETIPIINEFLENLSNSLDEEQKLQELVTWFKSHSCITDARILHISGIETLPPQSEILISFKENGVTKELILDISMGEPLKAIRYHECYSQSYCDKDVIVSATEYENAPNGFVNIIDMKIVNNCLKIKFEASGCDGSTWKVELIDTEAVAKSSPIQRDVRLSLDNKEDCDAVITKEMSFNIEDLRCPYGGKKVILHIYGSNTNIAGKTILYEY